jgi:hypothetical protein
MACVQIYTLELARGVGTDSPHEPKGICDRGYHTRVARLESRVLDMAEAPIERSMEIRNSR